MCSVDFQRVRQIILNSKQMINGEEKVAIIYFPELNVACSI